jgi:hypothetical protein
VILVVFSQEEKLEGSIPLQELPVKEETRALFAAYAVGFAEPDDHFGVHVLGRVRGSNGCDYAGERLDLGEAGIL